MSDLSVIGAPPGPINATNIAQFIFSNPYTKGGDVSRCAPKPELEQHTITTIAREKPLLVDPLSGELSSCRHEITLSMIKGFRLTFRSGAQISWRRTSKDALRIAAGLHSLGLQPAAFTPTSSTPPSRDPIISPVVLVHLPNCLPYAPILYGIFASGLTATLANPLLTSGELGWVLKNAQPQAVITTPQGWLVLEQAMNESPEYNIPVNRPGRIFIVDPLNDDYGAATPSQSTLPEGAQDWKSLLVEKPLDAPVHFGSDECRRRAAVILWSSGTSGRSKGVVLSHYALNVNMHAYWHSNPHFGSEHRWLGFAPFYHVFGLSYILLLAPCLGATVFVMPKFDPMKMVQYVQDYKITFLHMAPPVGVLLAKSPMLDGYDLSSLKEGVSGGAPFPPEILELVYKRLGFLIKLGYGLSEACSVCNQFGYTWDELKPQLGNTGGPMYGVEIKIISLDDSTNIVKRNTEGEILIRSGMLLNCYLNNKEATDESLDKDGWFRTGDIGKVDGNDYLWITDRLKEVIKVKG